MCSLQSPTSASISQQGARSKPRVLRVSALARSSGTNPRPAPHRRLMKRRRQLVLTVDHEIFGNGTGDARRHMLEPTERMARICEGFGISLTVFFEVEEYLAFERERDSVRKAWGYFPASELAMQAIDLARRGHDLQLHLHPEWVGARFEDESWILRPDRPTVDCLFDTQVEANDYIARRKAVIDGFYEAAGCERRVVAYRCGSFCAQPGRKLLTALAKNGILIDSSVVKGMIRRNDRVCLDFSKAPESRCHWRVAGDVAVEDGGGAVSEIPIYSRMGRRFQQLTPRRLLAKFSRQVPKERQRQMLGQLGLGRTPASILRFLGQRFPIKLDFHNMSATQMLRWIRTAPPAPEGDLDVLVLIGHSKEHRNDREFERFLSKVAVDSSLEVVTMSGIAAQLEAQSAASVLPDAEMRMVSPTSFRIPLQADEGHPSCELPP